MQRTYALWQLIDIPGCPTVTGGVVHMDHLGAPGESATAPEQSGTGWQVEKN